MILKKIGCLLGAAVMMSVSLFSTVSADSTTDDYDMSYSDYAIEDHMTVYDLIKVKRSLLAGDGEYSMESYNFIKDFLLKLTDGEKRYAKNVSITFDTEGFDLDGYTNPGVIDSVIRASGTTISIPLSALKKDGSSHNGWNYNGVTYKQGEKFTIPDENVVFAPHWFNYHTLTYLAGDYEGVLGNTMSTVQVTEGSSFDLASSSRFSRKGYTISGWECSVDGKVYGIESKYIIPECDITFTAVWKPAVVDVVLSANNGNTLDKINDKGETGTRYYLPDCNFTNGDKTFAGWDYDGTIYQPGEYFTVPALMKGSRVVIVATWK